MSPGLTPWVGRTEPPPMLTAADLLFRVLTAAPDMFEAVSRIAMIWRRQGVMSDDEFAAFKARCEAEFAGDHWKTDEQLAAGKTPSEP